MIDAPFIRPMNILSGEFDDRLLGLKYTPLNICMLTHVGWLNKP